VSANLATTIKDTLKIASNAKENVLDVKVLMIVKIVMVKTGNKRIVIVFWGTAILGF
jgi:hypothetical protein